MAQLGLARLLGVQEVSGSNPLAPTTFIKPMNTKERFADYMNEYRRMNGAPTADPGADRKRIRIALLASSTVNGLREVLSVKCRRNGINPEIYVAAYNQYNQEILNEDSRLYDLNPDLVVLFIDTRSLLGSAFYDYHRLSEDERDALYLRIMKQIESLAGAISARVKGTILIHNFEVPVYAPLGIIDDKQRLGFRAFVRKLNSGMSERFKASRQIFILDYESFCSRWGKEHIIDHKMYYLGDVKLGFAYIPMLCDEYLAYIKPLLSMTRKCIVVDLDNTLWGGVVGEDGLEGLRLGPTPEGRPYMEFQRCLLSLFSRGIILAINSRNNPEDALRVLRSHPHMILREDHFASVRINWNDKISNMKAIAEEINIGPDSLVFIDDDPVNREMMRAALPEVKVAELPEDPSLYPKTVTELDDFNQLYFSDEDRMKGRMYGEQRKRRALSQASPDLNAYLKGLGTVVTIAAADRFSIPRIAQLTQKTNQFTTTTIRYEEREIGRFSEREDSLVFSVRVEDRFGDNGITGAAIIRKEPGRWIIDSFLLSCRVIGRRIEEAMLAYILEEARKERAAFVVGEFVPTRKNMPARDLYKRNGFGPTGAEGDEERWEISTERELRYPDCMKVLRGGVHEEEKVELGKV